MRLLFVFLLVSNFVFSQKNNQQIAYQYYIDQEYEKAIVLYNDLINSNLSAVHYDAYYISLLKTESYMQAENLANKFVRKFPKNLKYQLGIIIAKEKSGYRRIEFLYDKFFKRLNGSRSQTINLANTLIKCDLFERAMSVYFISEKINPSNTFGMEKARLFGRLEDINSMLEEYLNELERDSKKKEVVTYQIQKFIDNDGIKSDKNYQLVKKLLLKKIRIEKERTDFSEMLIWLFMQHDQFKMALIQAKALDRRKKMNGEIVYELADIFLDQEYFDIAVEAYDYVMKIGEKTPFFVDANINKLYALTKSMKINAISLNEMDNSYANAIVNLGFTKHTVILISNYAHFKAFYLHDLKEAEQLLISAMEITGIDKYDLAECKMEYADILLLQGRIWDSMLYYSQVEKDFKEHPIGHEAKLRRAKISYYQGDFQWAQAQLEVLKASTSKLIANDAMDLSLLITDNYNLDTTEVAMRIFAKAELLAYQRRYTEAILSYDSVLSIFSGHALSDEIYMRKADIYLSLGNIEKALISYQRIEEDWGYDILADDALYKRAKIYDDILNDSDLAMQLYEKILLEHNSSIYVTDSRKRFRYLRGDNFK